MTETAHESMLLQGLDFDPPCERSRVKDPGPTNTCGGTGAAEWVMDCVPCCDEVQTVILYCTPCRNAVLAQLGLTCSHCDTIFIPAVLAYRSITPYRKADR